MRNNEYYHLFPDDASSSETFFKKMGKWSSTLQFKATTADNHYKKWYLLIFMNILWWTPNFLNITYFEMNMLE